MRSLLVASLALSLAFAAGCSGDDGGTDGGSDGGHLQDGGTTDAGEELEALTVSGGPFNVAENSGAGTGVGTITVGNLAGHTATFSLTGGTGFFIITSTGQIEVASGAVLNHESTTEFTLGVHVADDATPARSADTTVTVHVTDVNESPALLATALSVEENSPAGTEAGSASVIEPDNGQSHEFAIVGGTCAAQFTIDAITGVVTTTAELDAETIGSCTLTLRVTDSGAPALSNEGTFDVTVLGVNEAPVGSTLGLSVLENSPPGTSVGEIRVDDPDQGQAHTFEIVGGTGDGVFAIGAGNGIVTATGAINHEATPTLSLVVRITDSGQPAAFTEATFTVTVEDIGESPIAGDDTATVLEDSAATPIDVLANDLDEDGDPLAVLSATAPSHGAVTVAADGSSVSYQPAANYCGPDAFSYQLIGGTLGNVTVTVTCVNDPPTFTGGADQTGIASTTVAGQGITYAVNGWASSLSPGHPSEAGQQLTFVVTGNTDPSLFEVGPEVEPTGRLVYRTAPGTEGAATLTLELRDDGGTANGGVDHSTSVQLEISTVLADPVATDDLYTVTGNSAIHVQDPAEGVLLRGADDLTYGATLQVFGPTSSPSTPVNGSNTITTVNGGTVLLEPSGTFIYDPPPGFTGSDAFFYGIAHAGGGSVGRVMLDITGMIWFFDSDNSSAGDGRLSNPFRAINSFVNDGGPGHGKDGDVLFFSAGTYTHPLSLRASQKVIGENATGTFSAATGISFAPFTSTLPPLTAAAPVLAPTTGSAIAVSSGNTLTGFSIGERTGDGLRGNSFGTLTISRVSITGSGRALNLDTGTLDATFITLSSSASSTQAIFLTGVGGTLTALGGALTGATAEVVRITGGNLAFAYAGTVTNSATDHAVDVESLTGGSVTFSGAVTDTTGLGVRLASNAAFATTTFSGGLTLSGSTSRFDATSAGTLAISGSNNSIGSTTAAATGLALNVRDTTIGSGGLTFRGIWSTGGSQGIVLSNTGFVGGLTVTGTPGGTCVSGTCSGGIVQSTTGTDVLGNTALPGGTGIVLDRTAHVSLSHLAVRNHANYAVHGSGVTNFALNDVVIDGVNGNNPGSTLVEGALIFASTTGTALQGIATITNSVVSGGRRHNLWVSNSTGNLTLNASNSSFRDNGVGDGGDGVLLSFTGGVLTANFTANVFGNHFGNHLDVGISNGAQGSFTFLGNALSGANASGLQGLRLHADTHTATFTYNIAANGTQALPWTGTRGSGNCAITVEKGTGTGTLSGRIENNVIGGAGTGSGSANGCGIRVAARSTGGTHTTVVSNNRVKQYLQAGIVAEARTGATTLNATIASNTIDTFANASLPADGIAAVAGASTENPTACFDIASNTVGAAGNEAVGGADLFVTKTSTATARLPGYVSGSVQTFLQGKNPAATSVGIQGTGYLPQPSPQCPQP